IHTRKIFWPNALLLLFLLSTASRPSSADVGFEGLGHLAPGGFSEASDVSFDGRFVVGTSTSPNGSEAFLWEIGEGMRGLGDLSGGDVRSRALGVSDDGSVVVGYGSTRLNGAIGNEE